MTKNIRFYNRDGRWFADVPETIEFGGTEDDNELLAGADEWLDMLSQYKDNITLKISDDEILNEKLDLYSTDDDDTGASYIAYEYDELPINHVLWLCGVTIIVFGNFPKIIYYKIIK